MKQYLIFCQVCFWATIIVFSAACNPILETKSFPQEYQLTSERFSLGYIVQPRGMELKNGFLVFCGIPMLIHSTSNYSFVHSFGDKGQTDAIQLPQIVRSSSQFLYIMDVINKNVIRKYEIDSLGEPVLLQSGFTGITNSMNRAYMLRDSLILFDEFIPEASLKIHNLYTNSEAFALPYGTTSFEDRFFDKNMGGLYANDTCIAFVYKYQDRIDFYDWQFNLKHSINHQQSEPKINPLDNRENISYYGNSYMGRNYFYTLYRGVSHKVFCSDSLLVFKEWGIYTYGLTRDVLEVYDLDGQPVCRYFFNDIAPSVFVVDEEQNKLLGHRAAYPSSLLVYQLQGLPMNGQKYSKTRELPFSTLPTVEEPDTPTEGVYYSYMKFWDDDAPVYYIQYAGMNGKFALVTEAGRASTEPTKQK